MVVPFKRNETGGAADETGVDSRRAVLFGITRLP
jgi:hypothetical protein